MTFRWVCEVVLGAPYPTLEGRWRGAFVALEMARKGGI